jgi:hypothetical protein
MLLITDAQLCDEHRRQRPQRTTNREEVYITCLQRRWTAFFFLRVHTPTEFLNQDFCYHKAIYASAVIATSSLNETITTSRGNKY